MHKASWKCLMNMRHYIIVCRLIRAPLWHGLWQGPVWESNGTVSPLKWIFIDRIVYCSQSISVWYVGYLEEEWCFLFVQCFKKITHAVDKTSVNVYTKQQNCVWQGCTQYSTTLANKQTTTKNTLLKTTLTSRLLKDLSVDGWDITFGLNENFKIPA